MEKGWNKKTLLLSFFFTNLLFVFVALIYAQVPIEIRKDWNKDMDVRMQWWHAARYGMFIHWGAYAQTKGEWDGVKTYGEWIQRSANIPARVYENEVVAKFNPVNFNADEWVRIAQEAGMKYIIITTKHHDGFCMWDSVYTDYDIMDRTKFGRDPLKELSEACHKTGMNLGLYYSITDWHHPDFAEKWHGYHGRPNPDADLNKYVDYMQNQLRELLTNYGPIKVLWFDDGGSFMVDYDGPVEAYMEEHTTLLRSIETMKIIRSIQPDIIINDRLGRGTTDFMTPEQFVPEPGALQTAHNFESCLTINNAWGYNAFDINWKSPKEIVYDLVKNVSMGGNYLLNVGPTDLGEIDSIDAAILKGAGKWIHRNGEAIFGTTASPVLQPDWGRITCRQLVNGNTRLYLHMFLGSEESRFRGSLEVKGLKNKPKQAYALTTIPRRMYKTYSDGNSIIVELTGRSPDFVCSVIVLDVEGKISHTK
jgi:alpha-L-fucosidase